LLRLGVDPSVALRLQSANPIGTMGKAFPPSGAVAELNMVDWYFDTSFNFSGFISGRLLGIADITAARSNFSQATAMHKWRRLKSVLPEAFVEATYKFKSLCGGRYNQILYPK
jgi:hypothetical protein